MRKIKGMMNGLNECDLCAELDMMGTDDPKASKEYRTTSYMLPDGLSEETLKKMFCDLFHREIEVTVVETEYTSERVCCIKVLEFEYWKQKKD